MEEMGEALDFLKNNNDLSLCDFAHVTEKPRLETRCVPSASK